MRQPVEVKYDIVKNKLELPNFGGFTENVIMQDFWISMHLLNMAAVAKHEADVLIKRECIGKNNKYEYQANVNTVIGSLRNRLADAGHLKKFCVKAIPKRQRVACKASTIWDFLLIAIFPHSETAFTVHHRLGVRENGD